jgi:hypothetical protein
MSPQLVGILAQIAASNARVAGMQAENAHRAACGNSPSYGEDAFNHEAQHLDMLSNDATHTLNGRAYDVLAKFYGPDRATKANAFIETTQGACVLCDDASREVVILSHFHDKGTPVDAVDSEFGDKGWTQMVKTKGVA